MSLRRKAVSGVKWTFASQISRQVIQFVSTAILARLLAPSDYGLLAMALVVVGIIELFRDLGTSAALIQRRDLLRLSFEFILAERFHWASSCSSPMGVFFHDRQYLSRTPTRAFASSPGPHFREFPALDKSNEHC